MLLLRGSLLLLLLLVASSLRFASSASFAFSSSSLVAVFGVSRHSIKSTLRDYSNYTSLYINQTFGSPPSTTTPHGLAWAEVVGQEMRRIYGDALFGGAGTSCATVADLATVISDTDARDIKSGEALLRGLTTASGQAPCAQPPQPVSSAETHELLNEGKLLSGPADECSFATEAEVAGLFGGDIGRYAADDVGAELAEMSALVGCCAADLCAGQDPPLPPGTNCTFATLQNTWVGGYWSTWAGGLQVAAWLADTFRTQYVNGMAVFKNLSEAQIARLSRITTLYWSTYKNKINMRRLGGNLIGYLLVALESAARGGTTDPTASAGLLIREASSGHAPAKLPVFQHFMAHDVNVAFLREFLEASTHTPGYPPDVSGIFMGTIALELVRTSRTAAAAMEESGLEGYAIRAVERAGSPVQVRGKGERPSAADCMLFILLLLPPLRLLLVEKKC